MPSFSMATLRYYSSLATPGPFHNPFQQGSQQSQSGCPRHRYQFLMPDLLDHVYWEVLRRVHGLLTVWIIYHSSMISCVGWTQGWQTLKMLPVIWLLEFSFVWWAGRWVMGHKNELKRSLPSTWRFQRNPELTGCRSLVQIPKNWSCTSMDYLGSSTFVEALQT